MEKVILKNYDYVSLPRLREGVLFEAGDEKLQFFENYKLNINTPKILYDILITEKKFKEDNDIEPTRKYFKEHGVPDDTDTKRVIVFNG